MTTLLAGCVTTEAGLHDLAPAWHDLWRRVPDATPFQGPAWLLAWWAQFGTARPLAGVLHDGHGRLLGLLPAYRLDEAAGPKVLPIGAGVSDWLDALIAPAAPPDAAARLLEAVLSQAGEAALCDLIELPPGSALRSAPPPPGWRAELLGGAACPVLALHQGDADLRACLPAGTHRKLRMNRHRADRAGGATLELAAPGTLDALLGATCRLHDERWTARGQPGGVLADGRVRDMLAQACPALLRDGALRVAALRIGPDIASACLALLAGPDRLLMYMGGFSGAHGFCSPGSLLLAAMAELAVAEGRRELHFLRGAEPYKYAWGATDRHNATRRLVRA